MDRLIIGRAPANDASGYTRAGRTGVFVSKPSANVLNCSDGDLTFDTTAAGIMQVFARGTATIPAAPDSKSTGNVVIQTSREGPRGQSPVQVWWNNKSRHFANTITNLSFIEVGKNNSITTQNSLKNIVGYSLNCKTFIDDDGTVSIKFDNASQQDEQQISYTVFNHSGYTEVEEYDLVLNLTVRAYSDPNVAQGGNINGQPTSAHLNSDGRYYTVIFPDDFVYRKNKTYGTWSEWANDPFYDHRDTTEVDQGRIDKRCHITLTIPDDIDISGKDFNNLLKLSTKAYPFPEQFGQHAGSGEENTQEKDRNYVDPEQPWGDVSKYATYGPIDTIGRAAYEREALVDPCIILNMNSSEWTPYALNGTKIVIDNYGDIIGGGGFGSFGTMSSDQGKAGVSKSGGGGGGGAGHHMNLSNAGEEHLYSRYVWNTKPDKETSLDSRQPGYAGHGFRGASGVDGPEFGYDSLYFGKTGSHGGTDEGGDGGLADPKATRGDLNNAGWNPTSVSGRGSYSFWRWIGFINADPDNVYWWVLDGNQQINYGTEGPIDYPLYFALGDSGRPYVYAPWEEGPMIPGVSHYGVDPGEHGGYVYAGNGGSCIYLFANTTTTISGLQVEIINNDGGRIMSGGGGGGGGHSVKGASGGDLGSPGSPGNNLVHNEEMKLYGRYGEPGRIMWWNSPSNIQPRYTIINKSKTYGTIKGMDGDIYYES